MLEHIAAHFLAIGSSPENDSKFPDRLKRDIEKSSALYVESRLNRASADIMIGRCVILQQRAFNPRSHKHNDLKKFAYLKQFHYMISLALSLLDETHKFK